MQVRVIAIPPARVLAHLALIAANGLSTARATALAQKPFHQQRVAPEDGSGCCCVEHSTDKGQRICLLHAVQDGRQWLACRFTLSLRLNEVTAALQHQFERAISFEMPHLAENCDGEEKLLLFNTDLEFDAMEFTNSLEAVRAH